MTASDAPRNVNETLIKIFDIIETLAPEQQLELLSQLAAEKLPSLLHHLIIDLPESRRSELLENLLDLVLGKRTHPRRKCAVSTEYVIGDRVYQNFLKDISESGVFVQSPDPMSVGDEIVQSFTMSEKQIPFKFAGEIVRVGRDGFGVEFKNLTQYQKDILQSIFKNIE